MKTKFPRSSWFERIPAGSRLAIGDAIGAKRRHLGWSRERLAVEAEEALRRDAEDDAIRSTDLEREAWTSVEVTVRHIEGLEAGPSSPLSRLDRRSRLRGVCRALGLDLAAINRLAGGL